MGYIHCNYYGEHVLYCLYAFNEDLSRWDTSKVTAMLWMFDECLIGWDASKVTKMKWMFNDACVFNGDLSGWIHPRTRSMI